MKMIISLFTVVLSFNFAQAACSTQDELVQKIATEFSKTIHQDCAINTIDQQYSIIRLKCSQETLTYSVSFANNQLYSLIFSQVKFENLNQCYYTGFVKTDSCEAKFNPFVCESISLK